MIRAVLSLGFVPTDREEEADFTVTAEGDLLVIRLPGGTVHSTLERPFIPEELLRTVRLVTCSDPSAGDAVYSAPPRLTLDRESRRVFFGTASVTLTPVEARLFRVLSQTDGYVCAKKLSLAVWGREDSNLCRVYVSYLRARLSPLGDGFILSARGRGYRLTAISNDYPGAFPEEDNI